MERLACGHTVDIHVGARVYNYYDCGFGVVTRFDDRDVPPWHTVRSEGAEYWPAGRESLLDASRLCCVPCGIKRVGNR